MAESGMLLVEIDRFLRASGIGETTFGRRAINDPRLVHDLRLGRQLRPRTRARVLAFLASARL